MERPHTVDFSRGLAKSSQFENGYNLGGSAPTSHGTAITMVPVDSASQIHLGSRLEGGLTIVGGSSWGSKKPSRFLDKRRYF